MTTANQTLSHSQTASGAGSKDISESLIDRHAHFDGVYSTTQDLRIEGKAEGEIRCEGTVTIAEEAYVAAEVHARDVVLAGSASGEIVCSEHFTLKPSGEMNGSVRAASLVVEEGAVFEGEFHMADETDTDTDFSTWSNERSTLTYGANDDRDDDLSMDVADEATVGDEFEVADEEP